MFFLTKENFEAGRFEPFSSALPGTEEEEASPLLVAFKAMARDQRWLQPTNLVHKSWRFGYGFSRDVAEAAGCPKEDDADEHWEHACLVCWRSSMDGSHIGSMHSGSFGVGHLASPFRGIEPEKEIVNGVEVITRKISKVLPTPQDLKLFLLRCANQTVPNLKGQVSDFDEL